MLIYDTRCVLDFDAYGIKITSPRRRMEKTFQNAVTSGLLSFKDTWLISSVAETISKEDLLRVHTGNYIEYLFSKDEALLKAYELVLEDGNYHRYNPEEATLPLSAIRDNILRALSGTYCTVKTAVEKGFAFFLGGGMHHGHQDFGHGFCPVNDIAVAIAKAKHEKIIETAWVIDTDVHRGDGTADIFSKNPNIHTLSIHMANGWPLDSPEYDNGGKYNRAYIPGTIDIAIREKDEDNYLPKLQEGLHKLQELSLPDVAVVVAGADPYEKDELPSSSLINLSAKQMMERDMMVYNFLESLSVPAAWLAAGGYGQHSWEVQAPFIQRILIERYAHCK